MTQNEVQAQIRLLWNRDAGLLDYIWGRSIRDGDLSKLHFLSSSDSICTSWTTFFIRTLLVPPSRFRPAAKVGEVVSDHPQNILLNKVLECDEKIAKMMTEQGLDQNEEEVDNMGIILTTWIELQNTVNCYMDASKESNILGGKRSTTGIRQLLERKEGLFRKHMMGKRVNYCCRSVISPDPYLGMDEIGIPVRFAKGLHYPCAVTSWNAKLMRSLVENGPDIYPGNYYADVYCIYFTWFFFFYWSIK